jgi:hypothetical protein
MEQSNVSRPSEFEVFFFKGLWFKLDSQFFYLINISTQK